MSYTPADSRPAVLPFPAFFHSFPMPRLLYKTPAETRTSFRSRNIRTVPVPDGHCKNTNGSFDARSSAPERIVSFPLFLQKALWIQESHHIPFPLSPLELMPGSLTSPKEFSIINNLPATKIISHKNFFHLRYVLPSVLPEPGGNSHKCHNKRYPEILRFHTPVCDNIRAVGKPKGRDIF